ncbi:tubulin polyglutamylase TTLL4 [Protopterus annectens]|uniref:tubulin polyglutamylase TTLL4 n=1 Tax=Protopterus annectens TaxID=7888 RepID=UPI001CFA83F4|nr:tubulin polyglutamylase TTLL4 [Protopterus annectens]
MAFTGTKECFAQSAKDHDLKLCSPLGILSSYGTITAQDCRPAYSHLRQHQPRHSRRNNVNNCKDQNRILSGIPAQQSYLFNCNIPFSTDSESALQNKTSYYSHSLTHPSEGTFCFQQMLHVNRPYQKLETFSLKPRILGKRAFSSPYPPTPICLSPPKSQTSAKFQSESANSFLGGHSCVPSIAREHPGVRVGNSVAISGKPVLASYKPALNKNTFMRPTSAKVPLHHTKEGRNCKPSSLGSAHHFGESGGVTYVNLDTSPLKHHNAITAQTEVEVLNTALPPVNIVAKTECASSHMEESLHHSKSFVQDARDPQITFTEAVRKLAASTGNCLKNGLSNGLGNFAQCCEHNPVIGTNLLKGFCRKTGEITENTMVPHMTQGETKIFIATKTGTACLANGITDTASIESPVCISRSDTAAPDTISIGDGNESLSKAQTTQPSVSHGQGMKVRLSRCTSVSLVTTRISAIHLDKGIAEGEVMGSGEDAEMKDSESSVSHLQEEDEGEELLDGLEDECSQEDEELVCSSDLEASSLTSLAGLSSPFILSFSQSEPHFDRDFGYERLNKTYRTSANSMLHLKKHLQTSPPTAIRKLNSPKRNAVNSGADKLDKKSFTLPSIAAVIGSGHVTQSKVDSLIIVFGVNDMQCFSIIEQPSFINFVTGVQPGKMDMSSKTLVERVEKQFSDVKDNLMETLANVSTICTMADIWTHQNCSFFGITTYWINCDTLQQKSKALSCCRIQEKHTYNLIVSTLVSIHIKYKIDQKVCATFTDNSSNFVKTFTVFAECERYQTTSILSQDEDDDGEVHRQPRETRKKMDDKENGVRSRKMRGESSINENIMEINTLEERVEKGQSGALWDDLLKDMLNQSEPESEAVASWGEIKEKMQEEEAGEDSTKRNLYAQKIKEGEKRSEEVKERGVILKEVYLEMQVEGQTTNIADRVKLINIDTLNLAQFTFYAVDTECAEGYSCKRSIIKLIYLICNELVELLPWPQRKLLKWKMSTVTPNIVKQTIQRSHFRVTRKSYDWLGCWGHHMKSPGFKALREHQKLNHFPGSFQIGRKDRLWRNLSKMQSRFGKKEFNFFPQSFVLPKDIKLLKKAWEEGGSHQKWIVKPPASARGIGIQVVHKWSQVPRKRPLLVQRYLHKPYLISGSKFDLRIYVYVTSYDPLRIYIFTDGLVRFASCKYSSSMKSLSNKFMHLTNYSVNKKNSDYKSNTDETACQGHKWSLKALWNYLSQKGVNTDAVWEKLKDIVIKTIIASEPYVNTLVKMHVRHPNSCHELFGFDIMLDENMKPWVLEVNISPSLHSNSPLDVSIKGQMIRDLLNLAGFVLPYKDEVTAHSESGSAASLCASAKEKPRRILELSSDEKMKRAYFLNQKFSDQESYSTVLDILTPDDVRILVETEDELSRCGEFERIFPSPFSSRYLRFFEQPRYLNILLSQWEQKSFNCRQKGIDLLRALCQKGVHLGINSDAVHVWSSARLQLTQKTETHLNGFSKPDLPAQSKIAVQKEKANDTDDLSKNHKSVPSLQNLSVMSRLTPTLLKHAFSSLPDITQIA